VKHPILSSLAVAIILSIALGVGMEAVYPRRAGDMFGNEVVSVLAFPFIWFLGWLVINVLAWWHSMSGGENEGGKS
jgi:hypothetical protein